jgi:hypothetical protein
MARPRGRLHLATRRPTDVQHRKNGAASVGDRETDVDRCDHRQPERGEGPTHEAIMLKRGSAGRWSAGRSPADQTEGDTRLATP